MVFHDQGRDVFPKQHDAKRTLAKHPDGQERREHEVRGRDLVHNQLPVMDGEDDGRERNGVRPQHVRHHHGDDLEVHGGQVKRKQVAR